jgi:hypothetical protein
VIDPALILHLVIDYGHQQAKWARARALAERQRVLGKPTDRTRKLLRKKASDAVEESERVYRQIERLVKANG